MFFHFAAFVLISTTGTGKSPVGGHSKTLRVFISNFAINDSITIALLTDLIQKPQSIGSDFSIYSWLLRIRLRMWINSTPIFGELIWIRMVGSVALRPLPFSKGQICPNQSSLRLFVVFFFSLLPAFYSLAPMRRNRIHLLFCHATNFHFPTSWSCFSCLNLENSFT